MNETKNVFSQLLGSSKQSKQVVSFKLDKEIYEELKLALKTSTYTTISEFLTEKCICLIQEKEEQIKRLKEIIDQE